MRLIAAGLAALLAASAASAAPVPGTVDKLWRLDCGRSRVNQLNLFSDTQAYTGQTRELVASCYLIKDGDAYMLWDSGYPVSLKGAPIDAVKPISATLDRTILEQLAALGVKPEQIGLIGISHYHGDHIGQAADFPKAKLVIGAGDLAAARKHEPTAKALAPWMGEGAKVEAVEGDKDLFGDGSVTMIDLRGHTPGHHGLLVRLPKTGAVLLSGDVAHFHENLDSDGVPTFNTDRADSLAAMDRFRKLARSLKAIAIIQHDPRDVAKLPAFPQGAE
ncbi:N-acyl homoserine lactonase family protein [Rhizorhabdus dicambivorans]|uniref:N-acyl homoserine lactonase family protein n=1 Tax=Rhizorhabdus dicambivorans TaxID=1850238 RepID=A0A2A4FXR4_9SPHN|nr:N-acyl homoserine lactonase family protein [Rhizorhabdus dicambivorans]ATE65889.1 N-acyl homoserine lactonase family protein [Rhizorhabdus dicambivorans]PCE43003.1 N-acyl homoserine lactonase family protein [Rhizorhabdus dicambivorans]